MHSGILVCSFSEYTNLWQDAIVVHMDIAIRLVLEGRLRRDKVPNDQPQLTQVSTSSKASEQPTTLLQVYKDCANMVCLRSRASDETTAT